MTLSSPRLVFAGTPEFAAESLRALIDAGFTPVAVYTQPDRPAGRGRQLAASPVKQLADMAGIPVCQPLSLRDADAQAELAQWQPDLMIVAAYGLILPKSVLELPRLGCVNVHASLLPRWRGAAPIQRAIAAGDSETGITIMQMDVGLDTGDMLLKRSTPIAPGDTGGSLHDRLARLGGEALLAALPGILDQSIRGEPQDASEASYASKLTKEEGSLDWSRPAIELDRLVRAFNPWPGTFTDDGATRVRVLAASPVNGSGVPGEILRRERDGIDVACGHGALRLTSLQLPGARAMPVADLINGGKPVLALGTRLGAGSAT